MLCKPVEPNHRQIKTKKIEDIVQPSPSERRKKARALEAATLAH